MYQIFVTFKEPIFEFLVPLVLKTQKLVSTVLRFQLTNITVATCKPQRVEAALLMPLLIGNCGDRKFLTAY